jgi:hypothetical protein
MSLKRPRRVNHRESGRGKADVRNPALRECARGYSAKRYCGDERGRRLGVDDFDLQPRVEEVAASAEVAEPVRGERVP